MIYFQVNALSVLAIFTDFHCGLNLGFFTIMSACTPIHARLSYGTFSPQLATANRSSKKLSFLLLFFHAPIDAGMLN